MLGHVLDFRAGREPKWNWRKLPPSISQDGLSAELRYIYNDLNNPELNEARRLRPELTQDDHPDFRSFAPELRGCYGIDARAELMAEAFRAYMTDPNYIKTVAPNVARRIGEAVNAHPDLRGLIQFN